MAQAPGWYADPVTVGAARYWNGRDWTQQVAWGGQVRTDPTPLAEVRRRADEARAAIVTDYLGDAGRRHVVAPAAIDLLLVDIGQRPPRREPLPPPTASAPVEHAMARPRPTATPTARRPASVAPVLVPPQPVARSAPRGPGTVAPIPSEPGRIGRWWADVHHAVRSDLALHGLAYLGVLLLFAGVTGLIIFSFGDVSPWLRPVAEVLVPIALFVSAWYLNRRDASVVAASLTLLGGAITPIVVAASLTDGFDVPPDLSGRSLPVVQGIAVAVVGAIYAIIALRRPTSPLRHLAAPTLWLATGIMAGVWRDSVPTGYETARADSLQLAVALAAVTTTVAMCAKWTIPEALAGTTKRTALPVGAMLVVLELILAGSEGWPLASTIVAGLAALLLVELFVERLTPAVASIAQVVLVTITAGRLAAVGPPHWVAAGAAVALLGLVEFHGRERPTIPGTAVGLATAAVAFLFAIPEPGAAAVAFGVLTAWGFWRHVEPPQWLPFQDRAGFVPAIAAVISTRALWDLGERGPALIATSAAVLCIAVVGRYWRPDDMLWRWFTPSAAAAVVVVSMTFPWGELAIQVALATVLSSAAILVCALPVALRTWATAGGLVWAFANVAVDVGIARDAQAIALGATSLVLVVGAVVAARPICVHLATIGHVAGVGALAVMGSLGWGAVAVVAMATTAWLVVTAVDEHGEAVHLAALRQALARGVIRTGGVDAIPIADHVAPLLTFGGVLASVVLAVDASGRMALDDPWVGVIIVGIATLAAVVVRLVPWHRARQRLLAWVTLLLAAGAIVTVIAAAGSDREHWAPVAALALGLTLVIVTATPRPLTFVWVGWVDAGTLALFLADRLGLDRDRADVATAGLGACALLGGLAVYRRRHGPVISTDIAIEPLLLPPIVLGAAAFILGGLLGLSDGSDLEIGWTATGLALVVLAVALLIPLGALLALAETLATLAVALLAPWEPIDRPWTFAPWAVVLLLIALATRGTGRWDLRRWDVPSFLVAHGVALVALAMAFATDTVVPTYALFGAMSLGVAVVLRRWPWAAVGAALLLVAALDAGHGWLALVLLAEGVALTVAGLLQTRVARWILLSIGALALVSAWFDFAEWLQWSSKTVFLATMPSAAVVALVAAIAFRTRAVPLELAAVWTIAGTGVAIAVSGLVDAAGRQPGGLTMAASLLVLAATAAVWAAVLTALLRWVAALLAAVALVPAHWALQPTDTVTTLVGTGMALAVLVAALAVHGRHPDAEWVLPSSAFGVAVQLGATLAALAALPETSLLVVALLAIGAELVALGVLTARPELFVVAPVAACAAWLVYAQDAVRGNPNWFTVPIGLTMLVMVGLLRRIRSWRGGEVTSYDVVVLELVGMSFLVASPLARTVAGYLWNGVLAIVVGVLLALWGAATRVRWRAGFGAATVVLAVVLLVGVPLSDSVTWRGPALWIVLSVVGIAAIVAASAIERSRDRMRQLVHRLDEMTAGWERIPLHHDKTGSDHTTLPPPSVAPGSIRQAPH